MLDRVGSARETALVVRSAWADRVGASARFAAPPDVLSVRLAGPVSVRSERTLRAIVLPFLVEAPAAVVPDTDSLDAREAAVSIRFCPASLPVGRVVLVDKSYRPRGAGTVLPISSAMLLRVLRAGAVAAALVLLFDAADVLAPAIGAAMSFRERIATADGDRVLVDAPDDRLAMLPKDDVVRELADRLAVAVVVDFWPAPAAMLLIADPVLRIGVAIWLRVTVLGRVVVPVVAVEDVVLFVLVVVLDKDPQLNWP